MNLYHSNKTTGKFEGVITQANTNPKYHKDTHNIKDKFIYNLKTSSLVEPPECPKNESAFLVNGVWVKKIDRIGQHFYQSDGSREDITAPGLDIPVGCIQDDPPSKYHDSHDGVEWIENTQKKEEDEAESQRLIEIQTEQKTGGLEKNTVQIARDKIDKIFEGANTIAALRAATIKAFKLIIIFILK